jgi:hypothetical protein
MPLSELGTVIESAYSARDTYSRIVSNPEQSIRALMGNIY